MSKISLTLLLIMIALLIVATILELPFAAHGSGPLLIFGLVYAYWVARREVGLLTYAKHDSEKDG